MCLATVVVVLVIVAGIAAGSLLVGPELIRKLR